MSKAVLYLALSGGGKSSSYCKIDKYNIKGLDPKTTGIISTIGKDLDMPLWENVYNKGLKNYAVTRNSKTIANTMDFYNKQPHIKNIVIDDFQYAAALNFIQNITPKAGESWGDKYNTVLQDIELVFGKLRNLRKDVIIWILTHIEEYGGEDLGATKYRFKAVGKGTHNYLTPEGFFNIVLYGETIEGANDTFKKVIRTQGTPNDTCKTPPDMFEDKYILNDLSFVEQKIRKFYGI